MVNMKSIGVASVFGLALMVTGNIANAQSNQGCSSSGNTPPGCNTTVNVGDVIPGAVNNTQGIKNASVNSSVNASSVSVGDDFNPDVTSVGNNLNAKTPRVKVNNQSLKHASVNSTVNLSGFSVDDDVSPDVTSVGNNLSGVGCGDCGSVRVSGNVQSVKNASVNSTLNVSAGSIGNDLEGSVTSVGNNMSVGNLD